MMRAWYRLGIVLIVAGLAIALAGCGGGGNDAPRLVTNPYTRPGTTASRAQDLVDAAVRVDVPPMSSGDLTPVTDGTPEDFLGRFFLSSSAYDYYPLDRLTTNLTRGRGPSASARQRGNAVTAALFAAWLAHRPARASRATEYLYYTDPVTNVHWEGTYSYTANTVTLNVTGTRAGTDLVMTVRITAESLGALTGEADYSYKLTTTGTVWQDYDRNDLSSVLTGNGAIDVRYGDGGVLVTSIDDQAALEVSVGNRVTERNTTVMVLTFTEDGLGEIISSLFTYTADAWLFASDGYWVHGTATYVLTDQTDIISFTVVASDGYKITFTGTDGELTDKTGRRLAVLAYNPALHAIDVDFEGWLGIGDDTLYLTEPLDLMG